MAEPADDRFDVGARFVQISGRGGNKAYLPVQARIDWFRHDYPEGIIEQELVYHDERQAIFKATVTKVRDGVILGRADGYGQEYASAFPDYLLKAATVSIGRALNALGFGGSDLDEGVADGNIADAPVDRSAGRGEAPTPIEARRPANTGNNASLAQPLTDRQLKFIWSLANERGTTPDEVHGETFRRWEKASVGDLTRGEASELIDWLNGAKPQTPAAPAKDLSGQPGDPNAFTTLWNELRAAGITAGDTESAADLIGFWDVGKPAQMLTALREKVALMPTGAAGSPGNDKWSR